MSEGDRDEGAVTVEAALALCSVVAVLVLAVGAVSAAAAHLRCLDAARETARLVARGEPDRAREVAGSIAPRGASVDIRVVGDEVAVEVSADPVVGLPGPSVSGRAVGVLEPGAVAAPGPDAAAGSPASDWGGWPERAGGNGVHGGPHGPGPP